MACCCPGGFAATNSSSISCYLHMPHNIEQHSHLSRPTFFGILFFFWQAHRFCFVQPDLLQPALAAALVKRINCLSTKHISSSLTRRTCCSELEQQLLLHVSMAQAASFTSTALSRQARHLQWSLLFSTSLTDQCGQPV